MHDSLPSGQYLLSVITGILVTRIRPGNETLEALPLVAIGVSSEQTQS